MKKIILFIAIAAAVSLAAGCSRDTGNQPAYYWGHGFGMGYGSGCYFDRASIMSGLGLTNGQADTIAGIDTKYRKLYYESRDNFGKIDDLRKEHRMDIEKTLNDAQRKRFGREYTIRWGDWGLAHGQRHMGDYYGHGYGMGYGSGLFFSSESMKQNLGLTDDQTKKIAEIDSKYRDQYARNQGDYHIIDSLRLEHRKAIEGVLTPEQAKIFSEAYDRRWRGGRRMMGPGMMGY